MIVGTTTTNTFGDDPNCSDTRCTSKAVIDAQLTPRERMPRRL